MTADGFLEPVAWHASLPGVIVAASALIGDGTGKVLVVKPNYRPYWTLPGGICEFGESPQDGCAREISEELGVELPPGRLLSIDWQPAQPQYGPAARPGMYFTFDGGTRSSLAGIRLQASELDDCRFAGEAELPGLLAGFSVLRVRAALNAQASGCPCYLPQAVPPGSLAVPPGSLA